MRHWPLAEVGVVIGLALILLVPLLRVTGQPAQRPNNPPPASSAVEVGDMTPCFVTIRSPHPLASVALANNGETIFRSEEAATRLEVDLAFDLSERHLELGILATWEAGSPESAIEVVLEPDAMDGRSVTLWGQEALDDIARFTWP